MGLPQSHANARTPRAVQFALGYFRHNSHALLPVESCPISSPLINQAIAAISALGRDGQIPESLHGLQFFANHDDTRMLVEAYVRPGTDTKLLQPFAATLHSSLPPLAGVVVFAASSTEDETLQRAPLTSIHPEKSQAIGDDSLLYHAVGVDYRVSAGSFFQTNRFLIEKLVEATVTKRTGRAALDLYAGAGLFTAHLARNFDQVLAVESSPHSFDDLRRNVPHTT